jgi:ABC-2 type transport system permease protein
VVVPQYLIRDASVERDGDRWRVTTRIKNVGTGEMPIEIAAASGERFPRGNGKHADYRDARSPVTLGAGEERTVTITCGFEPERVLVDPDVKVLMLERQKAEVKLQAPHGAQPTTASRASPEGIRGS